MALRKPSEFFEKNTEIKNELESRIQTNSNEALREELVKIENISEQVLNLKKEITEQVVKTDLEKMILNQISLMNDNFNSLKREIEESNQYDIQRFTSKALELSSIVKNLIEEEIPKYKNRITKSEFSVEEKITEIKNSVEEKFEQIEGSLTENISDIRQEVDNQIENISEVVDSNLQHFNQQLVETSSQVKKTTKVYSDLSNILEKKVLEENQRLNEYSLIIENIQQSFNDLQTYLEEKNISYQEIVDQKIETLTETVDDKVEDIVNQVSAVQGEVSSKITDLKTEVAILEQHNKGLTKDFKDLKLEHKQGLTLIENYIENHRQDVQVLKNDVFKEIENLSIGDLQENLERVEKKIDNIREIYSQIEPEVIVKEVIQEGLLTEPPSTKNSDPLTPLDKNFVTLDQLQQHYRLFINRIQQQLSTIGGGGETQLKYLDDIVGIATNASAYDGKFLKYNHSIKKFEFETVTSGGGGESYWATEGVGIYTGSSVGIGTTNPIAALQVNGDLIVSAGVDTTKYITIRAYEDNGGTLSFEGTEGQLFSITNNLTSGAIFNVNDSLGNPILVADANGNAGIGTTNPQTKLTVIGNSYISGVVTSTAFYGDGSNLTGIYTGFGTDASIDTTGIITATAFYGDGSNLTGINPGYWVETGVGIHTLSSVGIGTTDPQYNLDVSGNVNFTGTLYQNGTPFVSGGASYWATEGVGIYTGSSVGIGTTNPISALQVNGDLIVSAGVDTTKYITIRAYEDNGGTLSFEGTEGQLFSITNNLTSGSIFNVNDSLGNPIIVANANGNAGIGTTDPTSKLYVDGNTLITGIITATSFYGDLVGTATTSIAAGTATTAINLSDAANILTGTINKDRISTTNALTVLGDLYVSNNISFGGTTTQLNTTQLQIVDPDIVLGIGTSFSPTDNTANHGGIAIASTEGTPLVSLNIVSGETNPTTYKKFMWFKGDTIGAGLTDAWLANYAIGIGSTQVPNGVRLAAGNVKITENDISVVRGINASGIVTGSSFRPSSGYYQSANGTNSFYVYDGTGNVAFQGTIGASQINNASGYKALDFSSSTTPIVQITNGLYVSGVTTSTNGFVGNLTGTATTANYATSSEISTSVIGGIGSITSLSVSGISTLGTVEVSSGIITATSGIITYYGDGSKLSNIVSGVGVGTTGSTLIGTGVTSLIFEGNAVSSVTVSAGIATINIQGGSSTPEISSVMMSMIF